MSDSDHWAAESLRKGSLAVQAEILDQADKRVQATLQVSQTLQQRASQAAVILFAATAVSAQIVLAQPHNHSGNCLAALGAGLFALGGCVSAAALWAVNLHLPWSYPSQWLKDSNGQKLDIRDIKIWTVQRYERTLFHLDKVNARRATLLNVALVIAGLASLLVAAGAIVSATRI